ncbi:MAG: carbon starvation protein A [Spirochaetota bacterium]|nr:carbon starvation protein A [Spirochaetota bacterium]
MNASILLFIGLLIFFIGAKYYSKFLANKVFRLDPNYKTPAHQYQDGVDFVPTNKHVLFGHHFTSVAGLAPILGPAIAVSWGWLPAFIWVIFGTVLIGAVHDFGTLWISNRHQGNSIGTLSEKIVSSRARILFLLIIFFLVVMVNAVFALSIAKLFISNPKTVLPVIVSIPLAIVIGFLVYRKKVGILIPSIVALIVLYLSIWLAQFIPSEFFTLPGDISNPKVIINHRIIWIIILLAYTYLASTLPVWVLLQPRDYINSHQLLVGLVILFVGVIILNPDITAPMYVAEAPIKKGGSLSHWFPLLFITIACGAISGFHGLVSSGTSSKQLNKETDSRYIGYGGMLGEGSLALISILACITLFSDLKDIVPSTTDVWKSYYSSGIDFSDALNAFVTGASNFASQWGISKEVSKIFVAVIIIGFATTSLDTSVRILKYVITEIGAEYKIKFFKNGWIAALVGIILSAILAFHDGKGEGGTIIWQLFGTTNQLIAGLSLLIVTLYLKLKKRPNIYFLIPMIFLLSMTSIAMVINLSDYFSKGKILLFIIGSIIFILELWLILEAILAIKNIKNKANANT